jgi:hypothetical protein
MPGRDLFILCVQAHRYAGGICAKIKVKPALLSFKRPLFLTF